jgi:uncharacterized protein (TIGR02284 family)
MSDKQVIQILNELIETSKDGQYGFAKCAERAESASLKQTLLARAAECESAAVELQALVLQHGGSPEDHGSVSGALHRGWVSVKDALTGRSDHALLEECERGEDAALARYRKALKQQLPIDVQQTINRQMMGVQANHDQIKALRDSVTT